jgi:hypothetical protein
MLPNLLVHIGYHKTATTWLQQELFSSESQIFAPLTTRGKDSVGKGLGKLFVRDRDSFLLSSFDSNKADIFAELQAILGRIEIEDRIPVLSYERLSGNPHSGGFDARVIADRIRDCFPEARILCVIREQKDMILSTYFQYVKIGGTDSLKNYLTRSYDGRRPGFSPAQFNYLQLVSYYRNLFSPDKVLVLPYEMFRNNASLFLDKLGRFVAADLSGWSSKAERRHNRREDDWITQRLPVLNLFLRQSSVNAYSPLRIPGGKSLFAFASRVIPFSNEAYNNRLRGTIESVIQDQYEAPNRELSRILGVDLSEFGYHR